MIRYKEIFLTRKCGHQFYFCFLPLDKCRELLFWSRSNWIIGAQQHSSVADGAHQLWHQRTVQRFHTTHQDLFGQASQFKSEKQCLNACVLVCPVYSSVLILDTQDYWINCERASYKEKVLLSTFSWILFVYMNVQVHKCQNWRALVEKQLYESVKSDLLTQRSRVAQSYAACSVAAPCVVTCNKTHNKQHGAALLFKTLIQLCRHTCAGRSHHNFMSR